MTKRERQAMEYAAELAPLVGGPQDGNWFPVGATRLLCMTHQLTLTNHWYEHRTWRKGDQYKDRWIYRGTKEPT